MHTTVRHAARLLLVACLAALTASALAQAPSRGRGGAGADRGMPQERLRPSDSLNASALIPVQLDRIEDELKLTEAQRPGWYAYADRVQKLADAMSRMRFDVRTAGLSGSATEQLDQIVADERNRVTAAQDIAALGRTLYSTLTPEQRTLADRRLAIPVLILLSGAVPQVAADRQGGAPR